MLARIQYLKLIKKQFSCGGTAVNWMLPRLRQTHCVISVHMSKKIEFNMLSAAQLPVINGYRWMKKNVATHFDLQKAIS